MAIRALAGIASAMSTVASSSLLMKSTSYSTNTIVVSVPIKFVFPMFWLRATLVWHVIPQKPNFKFPI